jgi:hypothetical protein
MLPNHARSHQSPDENKSRKKLIEELTRVRSQLDGMSQELWRLRAKETLEDQGLCLQLLSVLPAAVYTCDADGIITYFNQEASGSGDGHQKLATRTSNFVALIAGFEMTDHAFCAARPPWLTRCATGAASAIENWL